MQVWKLILAYDGTPFHGWQIQPDLPTVQGTLAAALHHITGETVLPQGSGRTDSGVHALAQVASVALAAPIPPANLLRALNRALPASIRILSAEHAPANFHARHSALRKTYEYRIFPRVTAPRDAGNEPDKICPPFLAPYVWDCPWPFALELAQQAAGYILGEHDFTTFAASDPDLATRNSLGAPGLVSETWDEPPQSPKGNIRTVYHSTWTQQDNLLIYRITGSGFLHHMVRNLVGTFVDVAAGRTEASAIPRFLALRKRCAAGPTAPAQGLYLVSVEYPL
jgi:tRNA pseudouridine38-40 synthase